MNKFLLKITEKWPAKVLSLAAALLLSVFFRLNNLETKSFTVPLQVELNDNIIPISAYPDTVRISLRGEANDISSINENDIEAYLDFGRLSEEGTHRVPVKIRKKGNALGVEPLEVSVLPVEISILFEQNVYRTIDISPVFSGAVASGFEITGQTITPQSITVQGPRNILENKRDFTTEVIDLDSRYEDFTVLVNIINDNPLITIYGDRMIEYSAEIRRIRRMPQIINVEPEPKLADEDGEDE